MTGRSKVYIAGVGTSAVRSGGSATKDVTTSLISAATKALLDAGVTYDNVSRGVKSSKSGSEAFKAFDRAEIKVDGVESGSELDHSISCIADKGAQCILMAVADKSATVALVLVSEDFLWHHSYLKDSSVLINEAESPGSASSSQRKDGLPGIYETVWLLRGWSDSKGANSKKAHVNYPGKSKRSYELSRSDAQAIPKWKDVEHKPDGKHRLGYNPASETKDTSQEEFEAVRAIGNSKGSRSDQNRFKRRGGDRAALAKL